MVSNDDAGRPVGAVGSEFFDAETAPPAALMTPQDLLALALDLVALTEALADSDDIEALFRCQRIRQRTKLPSLQGTHNATSTLEIAIAEDTFMFTRERCAQHLVDNVQQELCVALRPLGASPLD
ncbi:hypothetical protein BJI69_10540 [Luteibacter rhizovicinus DSM 16549]|uniref:Uncharacterized protein n=1 Tax=Luteibacter rhizovicinus DSM 16549 TaxID=1440763 RepID=A0A0G9H8X2_9GAMM|nr:hypothetical protein [Luteibacter rhizovicinus]APG04290.1 hypothetical protein BJI69_10540 [Luteibacter rhizovicinus DSM 16549]KLD66078.1 hypothetical protein Y883_15125 [Luteibacter rhizovicinus DSM 16549]KLD78778.1 hypothetical protein Y886_08370 [Xanthomonas hyacinthi DSM 19077]